VIAEGNETPGGDAGSTAEGRGRRSEGDLLAERRARRAAESGEHALTLRAEAAEATVRTLETHLASLQQRLREADEERQRLGERIEQAREAREGERPHVGWRPPASSGAEALERELQRVSQREYAEQRLRIEAEDRCGDLEREARAEIDRLGQRLDASERDAQALRARLETAQRDLAEAEQAAAAERSSALGIEHGLRTRLSELEQQTRGLEAGLAAERAGRERAERLLEAMQQAQRGALSLLGGLADTVSRLREVALRTASAQPPPQSPPAPAPEARDGEMAAALAAAVERLRARVEEQPSAPPLVTVQRPPHKHSMSLIGRTRLRLRQRRERRKQRRAG
jgi:chromosome segregation ATPase